MLAMEALAGGEFRPAINLVKSQTRVLRDAITRVTNAKGKIGAKEADRGDAEESFPTPATNLDTSVKASDEGRDSGEARDEVYELQRALPELVTLERYERRAMSRRKRAMRMFEAISIVAPFLSREINGR
jgi:predicted  nucleic acid-binding Zn-ribbon protein